MFRKKKFAGAVTIVEGDDDTFEDLGGPDDGEEMQQANAQELRSAALEAAREGKQGTARAVKMALETREVGVATAETLHNQTQQLEKISEDIEVVHDYLDKSDRIIDKMSKPKLVRMFQRKKPTGKGLSSVRAGRKEREARKALRDDGIEAVDLQAMGGKPNDETVRMEELEGARDALFDGATAGKRRLGRKGGSSSAPGQNVPVEQDYSHYDKEVADIMHEQDKDLDVISGALGDMKVLANAMKNELGYQGELIQEVQQFTEETSRRTKASTLKTHKI